MQNLFLVYVLRCRDRAKNRVECPDSQWIMIRYRNTMMRVFALKNYVTSYLMYALIIKFTAQDCDEVGSAEIARQSHAQARTSSRTRCNRIRSGLG